MSSTSISLPSKPSNTTSSTTTVAANLSFMAAQQPFNDALPLLHHPLPHHHHHAQNQNTAHRLANHALLPPLDIHNTRFSNKFALSSAGNTANMGTATLNSPSAAFAALGFGGTRIHGQSGLGISANALVDHHPDGVAALSDMFENGLSLNVNGSVMEKSASDGGWMCSSARCLAHNLSSSSQCYVTSNPSTPPRSASSTSSTFSFPPSPSSTTSLGSGFMFTKPQPHIAPRVNHQHQHQHHSSGGALSGGTSLGLVFGGKTLYSTPAPPPPTLPAPTQLQLAGSNGLALGGGSQFVGGNGPLTTGNFQPQIPLLALPPHLHPTRPQPQPQPNAPLAQHPNPLLSLASLTNILAPSGLRLSQGGRVRNVCPDSNNPVLMFWPDNEPLPVLSQCRPPLPVDYTKTTRETVQGVGANGLPPILNTGNVGPMEKQPLDWTCGVCKYINWRRRKVCQCCFPYAPGNEPPANHEDKIKIISALLTASSSAPGPFNGNALTPTSTIPSLVPPPALQPNLVQQQQQLLQMQIQLQIQKAQAQLNLFTQQQQQRLAMGGNAWTSSPSSEMGGSSGAGSPFVPSTGASNLINSSTSTLNLNTAIAKPATPSSSLGALPQSQSTPSPLSVFSTTKRSIWAMDSQGATASSSPVPSSSSSGSPSSSPGVDPEATVKLGGNSGWFPGQATAAGNKFGEIGSGKAVAGGVARKASLQLPSLAQFDFGVGGGAASPASATSRTGSPAVFGQNYHLPSSSSASSLSSLGMGLGNGSFGLGRQVGSSNSGPTLF
ncbi:hypothetical protein FRB90_006115 [Tulasnella sp. 427]|nr:hypothetical protein FRB90_006115 [Tulasnella sp. 427]